MVFEVNIAIAGFSGTVDMLVEMVRRYELDIIDIRIGEVARNLAEKMIPQIDVNNFTPFLTVSKLMFLKSRNLLPGTDLFEDPDLEEPEQEPEEEETQVRMRLEEQYYAFSQAGEHFKELLAENNLRIRSFQTRAGELPGFIDEISFLEKITPFDLMLTMNQIIKRGLEDDTYRVKIDEAQLLSNRISEIFEYVFARREGNVTFDEVASETPEKSGKVLSFLAVVYLVAQDKITAYQHTPFGEISIQISEAQRRHF